MCEKGKMGEKLCFQFGNCAHQICKRVEEFRKLNSGSTFQSWCAGDMSVCTSLAKDIRQFDFWYQNRWMAETHSAKLDHYGLCWQHFITCPYPADDIVVRLSGEMGFLILRERASDPPNVCFINFAKARTRPGLIPSTIWDMKFELHKISSADSHLNYSILCVVSSWI